MSVYSVCNIRANTDNINKKDMETLKSVSASPKCTPVYRTQIWMLLTCNNGVAGKWNTPALCWSFFQWTDYVIILG